MRPNFRRRDTATRFSCNRAGKGALLAPLAFSVALACGDFLSLEQQDPSQILAANVYAPQNANLLVNGAIGDFECAFFRYTTAAGLLGDELVNAFANTVTDNYDRRTHPLTGAYAGSCGAHQNPGVYTSLSVARASADTILARLEVWTDPQMPAGVNRQALIARAASYAGYSLVLLGEGMCSAAINIGPELTPAQLFTEARLRFDKAVTAATAANDATLLNFARLGRARTLLNLAFPNPTTPDLPLLTLAATDAAAVTAFTVNAVASITGTTRQQNTIFAHTGGTGASNFSSVDPTFVNLTFGSPAVADPRVAVTVTTQTGTDGLTPLRFQRKYANLGASAPVARRAEARLIVAEANALGVGGTVQDAVNIINELHTAAGIPSYDPNAAGALPVLQQVREERRRELFLESQRLGDIRRYGLPLIPAIGATFPRGGQYGDQRCFPLPAVERNNNPNISDV
jgi:hypothetical protein